MDTHYLLNLNVGTKQFSRKYFNRVNKKQRDQQIYERIIIDGSGTSMYYFTECIKYFLGRQ